MKTSAAGRAAIVAREGKRLTAYRDSVGVLTIGVGHTGRMAPPKVTAGMRITDAQCDAFLAADLAPVEQVINTAVKVPMTQNEFDALASLGFNIGETGLRRSMAIRKLNLGDIAGAAEAFMGWSKPAVLIGRRKAEKAQFLRPDTPAGAEPTQAVVAARAKVLKTKADTTAAASKADTKIAAATAIVAGGAVAAVPSLGHGHWLIWALAVGATLITAAAVITAVLAGRKAKTLAANAGAQARHAATLAPTHETT